MGIYTHEYLSEITDTGNSNIMTNKGFLRILQEAAAQASDSVGYGPNNINETHACWILLNWKLKIFSRPEWNKKITVKTWPRNVIKFYSCRDLEVYDEDNNLIAIATSKWVLFDVTTNGISRISKEMEKEYGCIDESVFEDSNFSKLSEPENSNQTFEYTIQRRDIDTNQHVNNTNYLDFAYEALPKDVYETCDFRNIEIMYKSEAKLGDTICCYYTKLEDNKHIISIKNKESNILHAIIKLY